ncbi:hypothetical protein CAP35_10430 [Chitinophagaceae bacterium IBVUCB1]|nr:hypothetical protein CAP35_10430 [Chitinophagaceae bacterium IBVUCB1]
MQYIDIHTHKKKEDDNTIITSLYAGYEDAVNLPYCSIGIHPWYADGYDMDRLTRYAALPNVVAIGECGLDKLTTTDWQLQEKLFRLQIALANELRKPLIIHCVRAYDEVLQILKQASVQVPVVFHGYNKNEQIAQRILQVGYYLSFGAAIISDSSAVQQVLTNCPANRLFLETDDAPVSIKSIYEKAASLRKTDTDSLILQLQKNLHTVFNI